MAVFVLILPIVLLLVIGNILRRTEFINSSFWQQSDKLNYNIMFPAMLITKVYTINMEHFSFAKLLSFFACYFFLVSLLAWAIYKCSGKKNKEFSTIYQGTLRFNSYIYFSIIAEVFGEQHLAVAILCAGIIIPSLNVLSIISFFVYQDERKSKKLILLSIIKNPFIIAIIIGFVLNHFPWLLPKVILNTLDIISRPALPLALLSVGASIQVSKLFLRGAGTNQLAIYLTVFGRLIIAPLIAVCLCKLIGLNTMQTQILLVFTAVPTATSGYILAKQMGGDAELMANIISVQTVVSIVTLPIWVVWFV